MSHSLSNLLLLYAQQFEDQYAPQNMTIALRDAADTITRLRERLEIDPSHPYDGIYCRDETIRHQDAEITCLTAEVERLRAALAAITLATTPETSTAVKRHIFLDRNIHEIARAALSGDKHE